MKIGTEDIENIKSLNGKLSDTLIQLYPDAEIYIIRGTDNFSNENYIKDAYFEKNKAYAVASKIKPKCSQDDMSDTYNIYMKTPRNLTFCLEFDEQHKITIYEFLNKNYFTQNGEKQ
ncbi:MAG: hypothetical protein ACP5NV_04765 [Candidatus Woesearchaeota archaeon]